MNDLILHPTEATLVPVTICPTKTGKRQRKPRARKGEGFASLTRDELVVAVQSRNLRVTTKHTKAELLAMLTTGVYLRPAALDRENARRKAKRAQA